MLGVSERHFRRWRDAYEAEGAEGIVVIDVVDEPLAVALRLGADRAINIAADPQALAPEAADKGRFGVMVECSGNERALRAGLDVAEPRGTVFQLGLGGDVSLPQNVVVAKELSVVGSFRFHDEFAQAVALIDGGRVDLAPMLTGRFDAANAVAAFELASDRRRSMKVQIGF